MAGPIFYSGDACCELTSSRMPGLEEQGMLGCWQNYLMIRTARLCRAVWREMSEKKVEGGSLSAAADIIFWEIRNQIQREGTWEEVTLQNCAFL